MKNLLHHFQSDNESEQHETFLKFYKKVKRQHEKQKPETDEMIERENEDSEQLTFLQ